MIETPKVSIVLPVYNGEKYLIEAIKGILNQTYNDFELIIVNDCSYDGTINILNYFANIDKRISVITNKKNIGLPMSLNRGFAIAKGEYFTWTSDDNIFHRNALEKMVLYLDMHPDCGLVFSDMNLINEKGEVIGERICKNIELYKKNCIGASFMYRSGCEKKIGDYDDGKRYIEDYDYWLRIASYFQIGKIEEILYDYRYHNDSLTLKKMKEIGERLTELRLEYMDEIIKNVDEVSLKNIIFEMTICLENKVLSRIDCSKYIDVDRVINRGKRIVGQNIWLFGAGALGRNAINILNDKEVIGFIDNDNNKIGQMILGKKVFSFEQFLNQNSNDTVVISTELYYGRNIMSQLYSNGIYNVVLLYDVAG